ncbi:MAG TPA: hypothetical protein VN026_05790 [Bacteroidia bacterium]|jgi:hypothetical protein|nr:hypothetical protein [Bacteroidia bacterium]
MKVFVFTYLLLLSVLGIAQENPNQLQAELKVKQLIEKKATYNRLCNGEYDGFRIKIHFGVDRVKAREIKTKFAAKFQDYTPYEDYDQPNFIIVVGDFRTKIEAYEAWKKFLTEFPNSFIIKSKIKPMRI